MNACFKQQREMDIMSLQSPKIYILGKRTLPIAVIKNSNKREQFLSPHENYMKRNYEANAYDIISDQIFNIYVCRLKYLTNRYRCGITNKHATDHKKRK